MRDFDEWSRERHAENSASFGDHPFKFRGEIFYVQANIDYNTLKNIASLSEESSGTSVVSTVENAVLSLIDPREDSHSRFRVALRNEELPVTFEDLMELLNWLTEVQTNRPPTQADSSSGGSSENGTPSTETSSIVRAVG